MNQFQSNRRRRPESRKSHNSRHSKHSRHSRKSSLKNKSRSARRAQKHLLSFQNPASVYHLAQRTSKSRSKSSYNSAKKSRSLRRRTKSPNTTHSSVSKWARSKDRSATKSCSKSKKSRVEVAQTELKQLSNQLLMYLEEMRDLKICFSVRNTNIVGYTTEIFGDRKGDPLFNIIQVQAQIIEELLNNYQSVENNIGNLCAQVESLTELLLEYNPPKSNL